jgi:hypothetical protein
MIGFFVNGKPPALVHFAALCRGEGRKTPEPGGYGEDET